MSEAGRRPRLPTSSPLRRKKWVLKYATHDFLVRQVLKRHDSAARCRSIPVQNCMDRTLFIDEIHLRQCWKRLCIRYHNSEDYQLDISDSLMKGLLAARPESMIIKLIRICRCDRLWHDWCNHCAQVADITKVDARRSSLVLCSVTGSFISLIRHWCNMSLWQSQRTLWQALR